MTRRRPTKREPAPQAMTEVNGLGTIQISEDVIAAVVKKYTLAVPGVARLAGHSIVGGLADMFGKRGYDRSIKVDLDAGNKVNLSLFIVIKFGEHVPTVATNVQNICRKYVEEITGQQVGLVNVVVQNLESEEEAREHEDAADDADE